MSPMRDVTYFMIQHEVDDSSAANMMSSLSFVAERERTEGYTHVVLVLSGSVASIKAPLIVSELLAVCQSLTLTS
jgi:hypothetical protein